MLTGRPVALGGVQRSLLFTGFWKAGVPTMPRTEMPVVLTGGTTHPHNSPLITLDYNALPGTTQAEAGWSTLKIELLPHGTAFACLEEARLEMAHYLDTYFTLERRHSALGYRSPHQFEQGLKSTLP